MSDKNGESQTDILSNNASDLSHHTDLRGIWLHSTHINTRPSILRLFKGSTFEMKNLCIYTDAVRVAVDVDTPQIITQALLRVVVKDGTYRRYNIKYAPKRNPRIFYLGSIRCATVGHGTVNLLDYIEVSVDHPFDSVCTQ